MALIHKINFEQCTKVNISNDNYNIEKLINLLSIQNVELKYLETVRSAYAILKPYDVIVLNNSILFLDKDKSIIYSNNSIPFSIISSLLDINNCLNHYSELIANYNVNLEIYDTYFNSQLVMVENINTNSIPLIDLTGYYTFGEDLNSNEEVFCKTLDINILKNIYCMCNIDFDTLKYGTILQLGRNGYSFAYVYVGSTFLRKVGNYCCITLSKNILSVTGLASYYNIIKSCSGVIVELEKNVFAKVYFDGESCKVKYV
jgi:hypothetical protein